MLINGKDLAVEVCGSGPAVVLVPGLGGASSGYELQAAALAEQFRVIRPDPAGMGRSAAGPELTLRTHADDLVGVLDAFGIGSACLVGHSLGSLIVRLAAARYPDRVSGLALLAPVDVPSDGGARMYARAKSLRERDLSEVVPDIVATATSAITRREHPEVAAFVRALMMSQNPEFYARNYEVLAGASDPGPVPPHVPLLLIAGEDDPIGPPAVAETLAREHGSAELKVIPRCGHWPMVEAAETTTSSLIGFLTNAGKAS